MKIEKSMIRECIINSDVKDKIENYIIPLQALSSNIGLVFFDYAVSFRTTFATLKEIDNPINNISKNRFAVSVYHFFKWIDTKDTYNTNQDSINKTNFVIPISEIGVDFFLSTDEILKSIKDFIESIRKWNLETDESKWKKNVKDLTPAIENIFNEVTFFKHILYSIFLKDGVYEYPENVKISPIRNIKVLSSAVDDYIGTINSLYEEITTIENIIQKTVDMLKPMDFNEYLSKRGLSEDDIRNAVMNNKEVIDDDF